LSASLMAPYRTTGWRNNVRIARKSRHKHGLQERDLHCPLTRPAVITILGPSPTKSPEKPASFASRTNFDVALPGPPSPLLIWERRVSPGCEIIAAAIPWNQRNNQARPSIAICDSKSSTYGYDTTSEINNSRHRAAHCFHPFLS
jgi:hypothetical protein